MVVLSALDLGHKHTVGAAAAPCNARLANETVPSIAGATMISLCPLRLCDQLSISAATSALTLTVTGGGWRLALVLVSIASPAIASPAMAGTTAVV